MIIHLMPLGDIEYSVLKFLSEQLNLVFGCPVEINGIRSVPRSGFNRERHQFDASLIIQAISKPRINNDSKCLVITDVDLYTDRLNFVFGQADSVSGTCIISLVRLRQEYYGYIADENLFRQRTTKEAVHELGHTFSLGHCADPKCVMHFSTSLQDTDIKGSSFCSRCRPELLKYF